MIWVAVVWIGDEWDPLACGWSAVEPVAAWTAQQCAEQLTRRDYPVMAFGAYPLNEYLGWFGWLPSWLRP